MEERRLVGLGKPLGLDPVKLTAHPSCLLSHSLDNKGKLDGLCGIYTLFLF